MVLGGFPLIQKQRQVYMSKAFREWKERGEWGLLHRTGKPKRFFTMRNYRRWRRYKKRWEDGNTRIAMNLRSSIMPDEWARYCDNVGHEK
jgi:hypothetical protein